MAAPRTLRRFPLNLGVGTDICHVARIHRILISSKGARFVQKILNTDERSHFKIQWLLKNNDPRPSQDVRIAAKFLAGRFAAKEAVIKAHPHRALTWHDITIQGQATAHPDRKGAPMAIIRGENEDYEALVSISHDGEYATAVCIGAEETK